MKYFVVNNFLTKDLCDNLIKTTSKNDDSYLKTKIHGGRHFVSSTSLLKIK